VLDEVTKKKLAKARETAPKAPPGGGMKRTFAAHEVAELGPIGPKRTMPYPRPEGCPDIASWVGAATNGTVLAYTSKPWSPAEGSSIDGTEHLWWLALPDSRVPEFRDRCTRKDAVMWNTVVAAGEGRKAMLRSMAAFTGRVGRKTATVPTLAPGGTYFVVGWLEV